MMAGYTATLTDVESGSEDGVPVVATPEKFLGARALKACGVLMLLALCGAATLFLLWHSQTQVHGIETNEHKLHLKQISGNVRAGIHLQGEFNPEAYNNSVQWRDGDGHSFFQGGLKLRNNEIIVPENGLYFVYSQVSFRVRCSPKDLHSGLLLSHMIMRWSDSFNNQKPLLSTIRSTCQRGIEGHGRSWYNAVYMGAIFSLEAEDRLWTVTNRLKDVEGDDGKTFFGVFAL
ncbi:hypothetical protein AAFF_G00249880 [Aldrovandia affinis]|uniref:Lymphotoxin-alpha n=1 Tax=Aldrovandia affinis TaxID=143900 RepID=A0AAD7RDH8_9TELE|nr:hypothetical protein AAFF_G00249880 [Aldrovandia affinis]